MASQKRGCVVVVSSGGLGNSSYEVICEGVQWHKCGDVLLLWHALKLIGFATKNSRLGLIPQPVPFADSSSFSLKLFGVLKPHPVAVRDLVRSQDISIQRETDSFLKL